MANEEVDRELVSLFEDVNMRGFDRETYEKVATRFVDFERLPSTVLNGLLEQFVRYNGTPLYVNEVKNYLRDNNQELFLEYGNRFKNCKGSFEVFGIATVDPKEYHFAIPQEPEEVKQKDFDKPRIRKNGNRRIKRVSKTQVIEKQKERVQQKVEKKNKRDELEGLMRKQDL